MFQEFWKTHPDSFSRRMQDAAIASGQAAEQSTTTSNRWGRGLGAGLGAVGYGIGGAFGAATGTLPFLGDYAIDTFGEKRRATRDNPILQTLGVAGCAFTAAAVAHGASAALTFVGLHGAATAIDPFTSLLWMPVAAAAAFNAVRFGYWTLMSADTWGTRAASRGARLGNRIGNAAMNGAQSASAALRRTEV